MKKLILSLIALILISVFFIWQGIYLAKDPNQDKEKIFEIKRGEGLLKIAQNLEKEKLIKNRMFFDLYVILTFNQENLKAGFYSLSPVLPVNSIAQKIIKGDIAKMTITIPEGFTQKQIEEKIGMSLGESLQGYLFPDTYEFPMGINPEKIAEIMKDNFYSKIAPYQEEILKSKLSLSDIVVMASLIEKEVRTKEEKELVSGLLWKRLRSGMPLQVDAQMWTYENRGLPLLPIANPGLESILAAIYPKESPYWYYLSSPDGKTVFSKTLEEHNLARAKYLKVGI